MAQIARGVAEAVTEAPAAPAPGMAGTTDRFTWSIVAGLVVLVVVALSGVALLQRHQAPPDLSQPEGVVRAYVEALGTGRADRAWDLLAAPARADVSREEFLRRAAQLSQRPPSRDAIERTTIEGDVARVEVGRTFSGGDPFSPLIPSAHITVRLVREQGDWRIEVPPDPYMISRDLRMQP